MISFYPLRTKMLLLKSYTIWNIKMNSKCQINCILFYRQASSGPILLLMMLSFALDRKWVHVEITKQRESLTLQNFTLQRKWVGWNKQQIMFHWDYQCASNVFEWSFAYSVNWQTQPKKKRQEHATNGFIDSSLISHFQVLRLSSWTTEQSNNELQKMWKEMVVALCKALACWKWGKPCTSRVSRLI